MSENFALLFAPSNAGRHNHTSVSLIEGSSMNPIQKMNDDCIMDDPSDLTNQASPPTPLENQGVRMMKILTSLHDYDYSN
jgi:hypothetical protein